MRVLKKPLDRGISIVLATTLLFSGTPLAGSAFGAEPPAQPAAASEAAPGPAPGDATPEELEQLVSPIALYPDLLIARILVASTFPTQIVEAHRWLQQNPNLKGDDFAKAVNAQRSCNGSLRGETPTATWRRSLTSSDATWTIICSSSAGEAGITVTRFTPQNRPNASLPTSSAP